LIPDGRSEKKMKKKNEINGTRWEGGGGWGQEVDMKKFKSGKESEERKVGMGRKKGASGRAERKNRRNV
jgi:hypothetical protein